MCCVAGVYLGTVGLNGVMNVDEDEEDGDQQRHAARDDLGVHQEAGHDTMLLYWSIYIRAANDP